jgi:predicted phosphodiesterase
MANRMKSYILVILLVSTALFPSAIAEVEGDSPEQVRLSLDSTSTEMVVSWITADHSDGDVEWGFANDNLSFTELGTNHTYSADGWDGVIHSATMNSLLPATEYYYRVGDSIGGWSSISTFSTAPENDTRVRIGIVADMDVTNAAEDVVSSMAGHDLDLVLFPGDISYAYDGTRFWDEVNGDEWDEWGRLYEPLSSTVPTMFAVGNHENEEQDGCAGCGFQAYLSRIDMPHDASGSNSEFWYSFNFSMFHIVSISSEHDYSAESPQYQWLENDLVNANQDREAHPWLITMFHRPMYSSTESGHGSEIEFRDAVESLLVEQNVDIVFAGHDHNYERTFPVDSETAYQTDTNAFLRPEAPIHLLVGTGGRILYPGTSSNPEWSAHFESTTHGYGVLELLDKDSIQFVFYDDDNGDVLDIFTIGKVEVVTPEHTPVPSSDGILLKIAGLVTIASLIALFIWKRRSKTGDSESEE